MAGNFAAGSSCATGVKSLLGCEDPGQAGLKRCLSALMRYHCSDLSWWNYGREGICTKAVSDLTVILDADNLEVPEDRTDSGLKLHSLVFSSTLLSYFESEGLTSLLNLSLNEFDDTLRFNRPHSLWDASLLKNSGFEARLRLMAVVFQDVTFILGHQRDANDGIQYHTLKMSQVADQLDSSFNLLAPLCPLCHERANLIRTNLTLYHSFVKRWYGLKVLNADNLPYSAYPPLSNAAELDPVFHHFYVPALLSLNLRKKGHSANMSFFAAFLFNTLYELRKIDQKLGQDRWPYLYPAPLPDQESQDKVEMNLRKIYTGYTGALFGIHQENRAVSYPTFKRSFVRDPYGYMKKILKIEL